MRWDRTASCAGGPPSARNLAFLEHSRLRGTLWIGLAVALSAWAACWAAGEAAARALFGRRYRSVSVALRLPLGLAVVVCLLEAAGYFLPLRIGGFVALLPVVFGAVLLARRRSL